MPSLDSIDSNGGGKLIQVYFSFGVVKVKVFRRVIFNCNISQMKPSSVGQQAESWILLEFTRMQDFSCLILRAGFDGHLYKSNPRVAEVRNLDT